MAMVRRIRNGETCNLGGLEFVYNPGEIRVFLAFNEIIDIIKFPADEVTTTQHFEEKCMWWANDYNQI